MPIKIQSDLPAKTKLESENIFVMDENRALSQDFRELQIVILNLMPIKPDTELQLLRALSNTPLQIDVTFLQMATHISKNTPASHLKKFYVTFDEIKKRKFDGMIITGALCLNSRPTFCTCITSEELIALKIPTLQSTKLQPSLRQFTATNELISLELNLSRFLKPI